MRNEISKSVVISHADAFGGMKMGPKRYHGLDLLRSLALLLGAIFHAAMPVLTPEYLGLPSNQVEIEPARALGLFMAWSHVWRMPLFFLLAGFFAQMVLSRRGPKTFLKDRAIRIFGVLLVFCVVFAALSGGSPLELGHLWFLWFLTMMCVLSAVLWHLPSHRIERLVRWTTSSVPRLVVLVLPVALVNSFGRNGLSNIVPVTVLDPEFGGFLFFWCFFLIGQALWLGRALIEDLAQAGVYGSFLLGGSLLAILLSGWPPDTIAFQLVAAAATLMLTFGLIGVTQAFFGKPSRLVSFTVRASYPVYIVHVWPAIAMTIAFLNLGVDSTVAVICSTMGTILVSLVIYVIVVRHTPVDWLFSGYRNSWFKWPWRANGWL